MIGLDTNVLVRYLTQDDKAQAAAATRLIEKTLTSEAPGFISLVALVEVVWVLESCYHCTRQDIAAIIEQLLRVKQMHVQNAEVVWHTWRLFAAGKADFADCLIERIGQAHECIHTVTFDKNAAIAVGMQLLVK
ncbi:MAG: type II toxin-antitoxin system VapC family toxin [Gallionellaceae bacterium]|nr:type II toxin-antitoxin system VapC family toxin [Gallionellaceae bacterium]